MINDHITDIHIDVELFSKAFNEIVKNAIHAVNNDLSKIIIEINLKKSNSPFIEHDWINLKILDFGEGIPKDFLLWVKYPFFTTSKQEGLSGFGLALVDKIINAHGGHLEIKSKQGSGIVVSIFIPDS